ncbi:putative transcriptional regulator [Enterobacter asburiae]|uniref:Putative transcriptional regulator n=1 Tax=Enterobacter asburiae TaxID=61645 RepID=A0A376FJP9_ENTAS|nr:putative transcriptional regulator [Enterobacter asburiae]
MSLINVAIVAVDGFSPFHYSVPCILFGDSVSGEKRFNVTICAETPGVPHLKRRIRPQRHAGLYRHWSGRYCRRSLLAARP